MCGGKRAWGRGIIILEEGEEREREREQKREEYQLQ